MSGHPDTARYLTTESMSTLSCSVFWLFLPNILKFDRYSFDIYCFKVGAFLGDSVPSVGRLKTDSHIQWYVIKQQVTGHIAIDQ